MIVTKRTFFKLLLYIIVIALALLPAANILYIIASTGANSPSNDYLRTINLIDQILSGNYAWQNYFRDTLENYYHSFAALIFLRLLIIRLTHGSIYAEIYIGYIFAIIKVILLYLLISPGINARFRLWLWPIIAALVFSTSQISMFTYGITALQLGLIQVGIIGGVLALARGRGSWAGMIGMILGGLVASWSGGGGLISWPIFLMCLLLLRYRNIFHYIAWGAGVVLGFLPYVAFGVLGNPNSLMKYSLERVKFVITAIGYPFLNQIGFGGLAVSTPGFIIGVLGLGICILGAIFLLLQRKHILNGSSEMILLMAWGVLNAIQTGASRILLAPWYTTSFLPFWIGLIGLSLIYLTNNHLIQTDLHSCNQTLRKLCSTWAVIVLFSVSVLYLTTNLTYRDKSFFLASRSPASASCLRNYQTAPTYCEGLVFQWGIGNPTYLASLAWPLEKHLLSVFAPRQRWTLQGDYVLGRVSFNQSSTGSDVTWLDPGTNNPALWSDYHHLNLSIPAPNSITWEVTLPATTKQATLSTALRTVSPSSNSTDVDGVTLNIYIHPEGEKRQLLYSKTLHPGQTKWQNITISFNEYAGKTINLIFELESNGSNPTSTVLRYPVINLDLLPDEPPTNNSPITPSNTDLSPQFPFPTQQDVVLDTKIPENWIINGAHATQGSEQVWTIANDPAFIYQPQLDICINDYPKFYMRLGVAEDILPRAAQVYYRLDNQTNFEESHSFWIPLLADSSVHSYFYDLRLLSLPVNARISGLRLDPAMNGLPNGKNLVQLEQIGLLHDPNSKISGCNP